mgnify:CR=1 FL=1
MTQALILVDIQNDYFPGGAMKLVGMNTAAKNAAAVLDVFREHSKPIFHIQHLATKPDALFLFPAR